MPCSMLPSVEHKPVTVQLRDILLLSGSLPHLSHLSCQPAHCVPSAGCAHVKMPLSYRCVLWNHAVSSAEDASARVSTLPSPHSEQELGELQHRREEWQARLSEVVEGTREEDLTLQMEQAR